MLGEVPRCISLKFGGSAFRRSSAVSLSTPTGADGRSRRISPVSEVQLGDVREARARPLVTRSDARMPTDVSFDEATTPQGNEIGGVINARRRRAGGRVTGRWIREFVVDEEIVKPDGCAAAGPHGDCGGR